MFVPYYLHKFLKLYISQTKNCLKSCFLLLIFILRSFFLLLIVPLQGPLQDLKSSLQSDQQVLLLFRKEGKLAEMTSACDSLSFVVTCCHSLYHWLPFVFTRHHSLYHSFSLVAIHCHSLPLDVSLVCLFINDLFIKLQGLLH